MSSNSVSYSWLNKSAGVWLHTGLHQGLHSVRSGCHYKCTYLKKVGLVLKLSFDRCTILTKMHHSCHCQIESICVQALGISWRAREGAHDNHLQCCHTPHPRDFNSCLVWVCHVIDSVHKVLMDLFGLRKLKGEWNIVQWMIFTKSSKILPVNSMT